MKMFFIKLNFKYNKSQKSHNLKSRILNLQLKNI